MDCSMPGSSVRHYLPEFAQVQSIELVMPFNHLILCHPLLLPSILSSVRVFSNELALCIRWSFSPFNEYSGFIFIRNDWFDLLVVQGTLKSLIQHHTSKASVIWHSAFLIVQNPQPYMTTGKTIALTIQTFAGKIMSLLFNMLSRFVIAFLSRRKRLFYFMPVVTVHSGFVAQENKICPSSTFLPHICHEVIGMDAMKLVFLNVEF